MDAENAAGINRNSRSCLISATFPPPPVTFPADLCQTMTERVGRVCEHEAAPQVRYTARSSPDPLNDNRICGSGRTFHLGLGREGYLLRLEHAIMEKCEHSSAETSLQTLDGMFPSAKALSPPAASRPPRWSLPGDKEKEISGPRLQVSDHRQLPGRHKEELSA